MKAGRPFCWWALATITVVVAGLLWLQGARAKAEID